MGCVDVGANYGYYTLLMASVCSATGRVVACEPNPLLAKTYLPQNLALNGFHHGVEICPRVVSNVADQEVDFILHESDFATSSVEKWAYDHRAGSVRAQTTTIDALCADWPRLDLVKIDAEGAELLVWEGMRETRERFPRATTVLELHLPRDPQGTGNLLSTIQTGGYQLRAVNYAGQVVSVTDSTILSQPDEHWTLWLSRP
jgi:FkbM family methyltransferase